MIKISRSPERNTFQKENYIKRQRTMGKEVLTEYLEMWERMREQHEDNLVNPEWQKNNLEYELRTNEGILNKVRNSRVYAQNLYAAMCNMQWIKYDKPWSCSWRYSGGIIADMREEGDYIDWYCSGIRCRERISAEDWINLTPEQEQRYTEALDFVGESCVTEEIKEDLLNLGWMPKEWEQDESSN